MFLKINKNVSFRTFHKFHYDSKTDFQRWESRSENDSKLAINSLNVFVSSNISLSIPDVLVGGTVEPLDVGTEMILDVTGALVGSLQTRELSQDLLQRFAAHVGQHVETATVGHAHHHTLHAGFCGFIDDLLHAGDQHFYAFQAKSFLSSPLLGKEVFEPSRARNSKKKVI